jgi:hypothetical protein
VSTLRRPHRASAPRGGPPRRVCGYASRVAIAQAWPPDVFVTPAALPERAWALEQTYRSLRPLAPVSWRPRPLPPSSDGPKPFQSLGRHPRTPYPQTCLPSPGARPPSHVRPTSRRAAGPPPPTKMYSMTTETELPYPNRPIQGDPPPSSARSASVARVVPTGLGVDDTPAPTRPAAARTRELHKIHPRVSANPPWCYTTRALTPHHSSKRCHASRRGRGHELAQSSCGSRAWEGRTRPHTRRASREDPEADGWRHRRRRHPPYFSHRRLMAEGP